MLLRLKNSTKSLLNNIPVIINPSIHIKSITFINVLNVLVKLYFHLNRFLHQLKFSIWWTIKNAKIKKPKYSCIVRPVRLYANKIKKRKTIKKHQNGKTKNKHNVKKTTKKNIQTKYKWIFAAEFN